MTRGADSKVNPGASAGVQHFVKRPKLFVGIWHEESAYFPHLDGASVMTFEAQDICPIRFVPTAENALAWTLFLCRHTELRSEIEPVQH